MGYWNTPFCVVCVHYECVSRDNKPVAHVRAPNADCRCLKFRVHLPVDKTDQLLICSEWSDYRGSHLNQRWSNLVKEKLKEGILYSYNDEYTFYLDRPYIEIAKLPKIDEE